MPRPQEGESVAAAFLVAYVPDRVGLQYVPGRCFVCDRLSSSYDRLHCGLPLKNTGSVTDNSQ